MRKTQNIEFTAAREPRRRVRLRVLLVVLAVFLMGALSFLVILAHNDFDFSLFLGTRTEDATGETDTAPPETLSAAANAAAPFTDENAVNVLFFCAANGTDLDFCELVSFSVQENAIRVKPVALESDFSWNGRDFTLKKLFADYSASAVSSSFRDKNIRVSRYVSMTESAFKQILQTLGDVTVDVPRDISFAVDGITYTLSAGEQTMRPDQLLKYMKYAYAGDEKLAAEGRLFAEILRTHFTEANVRRGEDFFSSLIDRTATDLSVFDYAAHKDAVLQFLAGAPAVSVIS